jgi:hypothetical protein
MTDPEPRLDKAKRRVLEARRIVERQKNLIERNKQLGLDSTESQTLLRTFERSLATFEDDLARVIARTKR